MAVRGRGEAQSAHLATRPRGQKKNKGQHLASDPCSYRNARFAGELPLNRGRKTKWHQTRDVSATWVASKTPTRLPGLALQSARNLYLKQQLSAFQ